MSGTSCGKTTFLKKFILEQEKIVSPPFRSIWYFYLEWQPIFLELERHGVHLEQGAPSMDTIDKIPPMSCIVLDDLLTDMCKSKDLVQLFTVKSHHQNISVIFVTQSFYYNTQQIKCVTRNSHYTILFRSPRMISVAQTLGQQIWPKHSSFLGEAFKKATSKKPYSYIMLNLHPAADEKLRAVTDILPSEGYPRVFIPKN